MKKERKERTDPQRQSQREMRNRPFKIKCKQQLGITTEQQPLIERILPSYQKLHREGCCWCRVPTGPPVRPTIPL